MTTIFQTDLTKKRGRPTLEAMTPLGKLIQQRRKKYGFTLEALSDATGVMVQTISAIERGGSKRPRFETLNALSGPLHLSMADLADPNTALAEMEADLVPA